MGMSRTAQFKMKKDYIKAGLARDPKWKHQIVGEAMQLVIKLVEKSRKAIKNNKTLTAASIFFSIKNGIIVWFQIGAVEKISQWSLRKGRT